jgi:hypothetical protein
MDNVLKWLPLLTPVILFFVARAAGKLEHISRRLENHGSRLVAVETRCGINHGPIEPLREVE